MMRRKCTLSIWLVVVIAILAVMPAQASWLSNQVDNVKAAFYGVTKHYSTPTADIAGTEMLSADSSQYSSFDFSYWNGQKPFFGDSVVNWDIMVKSGTPTNNKVRVYVSDPSAMVPINDKRKRDKWDFGGLIKLGDFQGKSGRVPMECKDLALGRHMLYNAIEANGKYELYGEPMAEFWIGPPLLQTINGLQNAPDEILAQWGLVATYEEVAKSDTSSKANWRLSIDGRTYPTRSLGKPKIGRYIGFYSDTAREAVAKITDFKKDIFYGRWMEGDISGFKPGELTPAWVVWGEVHSTKGDAPLTAEQERNLATYPDKVRGMILEMAQSPTGVKHLKESYRKNMSRQIEEDYQIWTAFKHDWTLAPVEMWVPEKAIEKARVIRLVNGVPTIAIFGAAVELVNRPGFGNGIMGIFAQMARRPDRFNLSADAYAKGGAGGSSIVTNNNSNSNANTNVNNNVINAGSGSASGWGSGNSGATSISGN